MDQLLLTIIPLDFAATLSPGILALTLILLGTKKHALTETFSLLLGNLITAGIIISAAFFMVSITTSQSGPNIIVSIIDLLLGLFFIGYGVKVFRTRDGKFKLKEKKSASVFKWVVIGFIISITNFDAVLLSFTATREVAASSLGLGSKMLLSVVNVLFFVLPIILPLGICMLFPKIGTIFLTRLNKYVIKYSRYIICIMFLVFGVYFVLRAIKHL
jgi:hypothetical protein